METHWKKLTNPNYLGSYSLAPGERRVVQIVSVSQELVTGPDGAKEQCIVATLKNEKPLILNKTNCKIIEKMTGTPYIEKWAGVKITVYSAKVKAFGDVVDALRVEPTAPALPDLTPTHPKWNAAKKSLADKQITMDQLKANYKISKQHEADLLK